MSDETPPPIRLKPRVRPSAEPVSPAAPSVPAPPTHLPAEEPLPAAPSAPPAATNETAEGGARLRLKPKLSVTSESGVTPPVISAPAPSGPTAASASEEPRLRMKPRLTVEKAGEAPSPVASVSPAAPELAAAPAPSPLMSPLIGVGPAAPVSPIEPTGSPLTPPPAAASDAPRLKIKPASTISPAPLAGAVGEVGPPPLPSGAPEKAVANDITPSSATTVPSAATSPDHPVATGSAPSPAGAPKLKVPHMRAPAVAEEKLQPKAPKPEHSRAFKTGVAGFGIFGFLLFAGASYYIYDRFFAPPAPAPPVVSKPVGPSAGDPKAGAPAAAPTTPSATVGVASLPGQMINKAQDALNARRENEQSRVDSVVEGREPGTARALNTPPPSELGKEPAPAAPVVVPPTERVTTVPTGNAARFAGEVEASTNASAAFKRFVTDARIGGVFQGQPARAFINNRTVRAGETIELQLGVVFERADVEKKLLVFRDKTGAIVVRRY